MKKVEKFSWSAYILPNKQAEYIKRHQNIWPEMKQVLAKAGIVNYTIWLGDDNRLFGYYECTKGIAYAMKIQNNSPVVKRWNEYMKDVMMMKVSKKAAQPKLKKVFSFK